MKYLLDVAKVSGSDVASASSSPDASSSWVVKIAFSSRVAVRVDHRDVVVPRASFSRAGCGWVVVRSSAGTGW